MAASGHFKENSVSNDRKRAAIKPLRMMMSVPDDRFALETRLIVLNFMGLVPASCPASAAVSDGLRLNESVDEAEEDEIVSHPAMPRGFWQQPLKEEADEMDDIQPDDSSLACTLPFDSATSQKSANPEPETESEMKLLVPAVELSEESMTASDILLDHLSLHLPLMPQSLMPVTSQLQLPNSASPYSVSPSLSPVVERQFSQKSNTSSTRSRLSGRLNSYIDVRLVDVESLVKTRSVTPLALPLRDELFREFDFDRFSDEPAGAEGGLALTPESEVAEMLRILGDRVQEEFGEELQRAAAALIPRGRLHLSYTSVRDVALRLLGNTAPGWTQVVLVMLLGQRVAMSQLMRGDHSIGKLADYTTQFIGDYVADFIIRSGGWQSILDLDCDKMLDDDKMLDEDPSTERSRLDGFIRLENVNGGVLDIGENRGSEPLGVERNLLDHLDGEEQCVVPPNGVPPAVAEHNPAADQSSQPDSEQTKFVASNGDEEGSSLKMFEDVGSSDNAVYVALCAVAVAGACYFCRKLWKH